MTSTSLENAAQYSAETVPSLHTLRSDQLKAARLSHDDLGRRLARRMASILRSPVEIHLGGLTSETLSSLFGRIESTSTVVELRLQAGAAALLILENSACLSVVERMLGGMLQQPHQAEHLNSVELKILRSVLGQLTCEFSSCWPGPESAHLSIGGIFPKPETAPKEAGNSPHLVFSYTCQLGGLESGMQIALPFEALLRILDRGTASSTPASLNVRNGLLEAMAAPLAATAVEVEVLLDGGTIRLGTLSQIAPGSLLLLDTGLETQAEAVINGSVKLAGSVVRQGPKRLFRFSSVQNPG